MWGARSWQTTSRLCHWQRWQAVNRENAISFVVNYQPTQSDTRLHISQDALTAASAATGKLHRDLPHFLPTRDSKAEMIHLTQIPTSHGSWISRISTHKTLFIHLANVQWKAFSVHLKIASDSITSRLPFSFDESRKQRPLAALKSRRRRPKKKNQNRKCMRA